MERIKIRRQQKLRPQVKPPKLVEKEKWQEQLKQLENRLKSEDLDLFAKLDLQDEALELRRKLGIQQENDGPKFECVGCSG